MNFLLFSWQVWPWSLEKVLLCGLARTVSPRVCGWSSAHYEDRWATWQERAKTWGRTGQPLKNLFCNVTRTCFLSPVSAFLLSEREIVGFGSFYNQELTWCWLSQKLQSLAQNRERQTEASILPLPLDILPPLSNDNVLWLCPEFLRGGKLATEQIPELQERFSWTQWVSSTSLFLFMEEGCHSAASRPTLTEKAAGSIQPAAYHAEGPLWLMMKGCISNLL